MKTLIITLQVAFFSTSALAGTPSNADCSFLTGSVFVCYFDGTSGLEIFEAVADSQISRQETADDGSIKTEVLTPVVTGYDLDIKSCVSEAFSGEATTTCFLNETAPASGFSTARPVPQKTVIKRIDRR